MRVSGHPSNASTKHAAHVRPDVITNVAELEGLQPQWERLVLTSGGASAFSTPAGILTWYRHVQHHSGIYAVTVWNGDELVGIAPFSVTRFGFFRLLSTAGAGYGYYGEPLLGPDPGSVAQAITDHLSRQVSAGAAAVYFRRLRGDGTMVKVLSARNDLVCRQLGSDEVSSVVRFDQIPDADQYFSLAARKHAIPRCWRRLAKHFGQVEYLSDDPDPDMALDTMRDMLRRRHESDLRIFRTPQNRALTRDLVHELIKTGYAKVSSIIADGQRIAVTVDLQVGPRVLGYAVACEPELKKFSLGHVELYETLRRAQASGVIEVDLGSAGFAYKQNWANTTSHFQTFAMTAPGWRGKTADNLRRAAIRRHRAGPLDPIGPHVV